HLDTKDYRGPIITADLFGKGAARIILANEDFPVSSPFFKLPTGTPLEYALFMFSQKLGAILTYFLIQSMDPSNKIAGDTKNGEEKDLNVQRWIDDAISSLRGFLLPIFKQLVISFISYFDSIKEDFA